MRFLLFATMCAAATPAFADGRRSTVDIDDCKALGVSADACVDMASKALADSFGPLSIGGCAALASDAERLECYDDFARSPENPIWRAVSLDLLDLR